MLFTRLFLFSFQSSSRRSLHTSGTGSQSSVSSKNSQFSLQNVTWEASKTNLFGISEQWILTWHLLPTDVFWALLREIPLLERGKQLPSCDMSHFVPAGFQPIERRDFLLWMLRSTEGVTVPILIRLRAVWIYWSSLCHHLLIALSSLENQC